MLSCYDYVGDVVQVLKWIKTFHQSCPKTKMRSCLRTTLMNFFDPLEMLTTIYSSQKIKMYINIHIYARVNFFILFIYLFYFWISDFMSDLISCQK